MSRNERATNVPSPRHEAQAPPQPQHELVGWLRSTTPERVLMEVARALADGVGEDDLWAAAALTAARMEVDGGLPVAFL